MTQEALHNKRLNSLKSKNSLKMRSSISNANILFNRRPEVKAVALRDNDTSYTIVKRGDLYTSGTSRTAGTASTSGASRTAESVGDPNTLLQLLLFSSIIPSTTSTTSTTPSIQFIQTPQTSRNSLPSILELRDSIARNIIRNDEQVFAEFVNRTLINHQSQPTPLALNILNNLEEVSASSLENAIGEKCSICLEEFNSEDTLISLHCGHMYHNNCLRQWFTEKNTCPQCRAVPRISSSRSEN